MWKNQSLILMNEKLMYNWSWRNVIAKFSAGEHFKAKISPVPGFTLFFPGQLD
jgi:hypothetical protein